MNVVPPKIDVLPEHLIDQIKAGEVIERPGNLLKEILENAVDAGATKLELLIQNNGLDLISLKDNGHGMTFEDLPLAFSRHATSKISRFEDLYRLRSFGFRGEALASIAAISRLQCISFIALEVDGAELRIEGGQTVYHGKRKISGVPHGTELIIQDLFYNTPARLKFIQSQNAEKQFIKKIIYSFVLSNPQIEFQIKMDEEEKEIFMRVPDVFSRLKDILPKAKEHILHVERYYENNELELYVIPGQFKASLKWQYVFINNRFVLDKQFHRVVANSLETCFARNDFHYLAFLNMPSENIDVNVHPNKTIIKCLECSKVIGLLISTVKELAGGKKASAPVRQTLPQSPLLSPTIPDLTSMPTLTQERHQYNMEGMFSPHTIKYDLKERLHWIGQEYFSVKREGRFLAYSAKKLLQEFIKKRLDSPSATLPLLVSEPFSAKGVSKETLSTLQQAGLELEKLGPETLVLRGIPEWMNGLPLKGIVQCLLLNIDFRELVIDPDEWSTSTWEDMLTSFRADELLKEKIAADLVELLKSKLK